jgi:uncharacterized protein (DUF2344 family)
MLRPRYRIRYRKLDDLRLVGHHDLARLWERLLRRAEVKPAMSEGFHRRPRMNFPSALAVGIGGLDEVIELELSEERDPADLAAALERHAPPGLSIARVDPMGDGTRFSQPAAATYEVPLPAEQVSAVKARIEKARIEARRAAPFVENTFVENTFVENTSVENTSVENTSVENTPETAEAAVAAPPAPDEHADEPSARNEDTKEPFEKSTAEKPTFETWPASIRSLDVVDGVLRMDLRLGEAGAVRPRDLLALLELTELESQGAQITRTRVELSS